MSTASFQFDPIEDALAAFKAGEFVVVMDDEGRENEGDLVIAASECTTKKMAWFIKHTSGYICISLPEQRLQQLEIPMMVPDNQERHKTAYTVTVDARQGKPHSFLRRTHADPPRTGISTGISAHDRALTARLLADPSSKPSDFTRPGHMVPLRYTEGGVLARPGHTEAATDLCRLTGLPPAGLLCELVKPDDDEGSMARRDDCSAFAEKWGLKMISIEQLREYCRRQ